MVRTIKVIESKDPFVDAVKLAFGTLNVNFRAWSIVVDGTAYRIVDPIARFSFIMFTLYKQKLRPFTFEIDDENDRIFVPDLH